MNYVYVDQHTEECKLFVKRTEEQQKENSFAYVHHCSYSMLLLQIDFEYYIFHYPQCLGGCNHLDFIEMLIHKINSKKILNKKFNRGDVYDRKFYEKDTKKNLRDFICGMVTTDFREIVYTYQNAARKDYCFSINHKGTDCIIKSLEKLRKSYDETKDFINTNIVGSEHEYLADNILTELDELYWLNDAFGWKGEWNKDFIMETTLDYTLKEIKNKLKEI